MNFLEAVKAMKEGKKVRLPYWLKENAICCKIGSNIESHNENEFALSCEDVESNAWEIVEEKKSLSDNIYLQPDGRAILFTGDVREALKEFLNILKCDANNTDEDRERVDWLQIKSRAKEIFGERLI